MTRVGNQTNSTDPHSVNSRIFVGNLNTYVVTKEDVERIFSRYGRVIGISMHKGYAFVQFTDAWDARNSVVGEDGRTVAGQVLDVNMVSEPKPHQINRKRQILVGNPANTFLGIRQAAPPLKRQRTDLLGFPMTSRPKTKPAKLSDKQQASLNSLYSNGEPDILICGNCKEIFPGIHKLIEHKKQTCKLRFTCRCQQTSSPPGAPAKPVCAKCQTKQNTWWDLVQHFQSAHGSTIYQWEDSSTNSVDSPLGDDPLQSQSGELTSSSSVAHDQKEESCCSDSQSGMPDWDSLEVNNGAAEEECDDVEGRRMLHPQELNHHMRDEKEDKAVDTADLGIPVGQG